MTQPLVDSAAATAEPVLETIPPLRLGDQWGRNGKEFLNGAREALFARHLAGASGETIVSPMTTAAVRMPAATSRATCSRSLRVRPGWAISALMGAPSAVRRPT